MLGSMSATEDAAWRSLSRVNGRQKGPPRPLS
jgi:hypothetical protein